MAQHPTDMRMGVNGMCGQVRKVGLEPANGDVYIFVGKSRTTMKLLHWERGGYVMYYKRLEQGRFHPRNHPKQAAFSISLILFTFVPQKTVMFNLNEVN